MLILLPPSETKRAGGTGPPLGDFARLSFEQQNPIRARLIENLVTLTDDREGCIRVLKLGPTQLSEIEVNRNLQLSPTMPAVERFTGVLYDALGVDSLQDDARNFVASNVVIQSALFGLIRANDFIPAYRLSFDARLPGTSSIVTQWREVGSAILAETSGLIVDLRSEGYAALAPLPSRADAVCVRALGRARDGSLRALNHFNKKGKGLFVGALARSSENARIHDVSSLLEWAQSTAIELRKTVDPNTLDLVINEADHYAPAR